MKPRALSSVLRRWPPIAIGIAIAVVTAACRRATPPTPAAPTALPTTVAAATPVITATPVIAATPVIIERTTLDDGRAATVRYDFDADALRAVVAVDGGVIAATTSGNLLRFTSDLTAERVQLVSPPVTALAAGPNGAVLACLGDGTVATVDPRSLALARLGAVPGAPRWLGHWGKQLIVVADEGGARRVYRLDAQTGAAIGEPIDAVGGSTWAIDASGRLWWGVDAGEWGGSAGSIDLASGKPGPEQRVPDGVTGLLVHGDDVVAYGGTTHMGYTSGSLTSLAKHTRLAAPPPTAPADGAEPIALPVTRMIASGDRLVAFLWNLAFTVDPTLTTWTRVGALPARVRWGRPDAVGSYPAIVDAVTLPDGAVVVATVRDGLFRIRAGTITAHALRGPVGFAPGRLFATAGTVVADDDGTLWRQTSTTWQPLVLPDAVTNVTEVTLAPRAHAAPLVTADTWDGLRVIEWNDAGPTVVDRAPHRANVAAAVGVGDELWRIGDGSLWQWQADTGAWRSAGRYRERDTAHPRPGDLAMMGQLAGAAVGDQRLIVDGFNQRLLRLTIDGRGVASLVDLGAADRVVALDATHALVVRNRELFTYTAATGALARYPVALAPVITAAAEPGGRLWCATDAGLVVIDDRGAHRVAATALTGRRIEDVVIDPAGGAVASLAGGGLLHVALE